MHITLTSVLVCLSFNVYSQHISEHHYFNGDGGGAYLDKMRRFDDKTALWFGAACDTISMDSAPFLFHSSTPPSFYPFLNSTQAYFVLLDSAQIPKIKLHFSAKRNIRPISMEKNMNGDFLLTYMISDDTVYLNGSVFISDTLIKKGALCLTKVSWDGNIVFTRYFPCGSALSAYIVTLPDNKIALAGHISYPDITFDNFTLHCLGCHVEDTDIFVAVLDSNGYTLKAKRFGGERYDYCWNAKSSPQGDIYLTGSFESDFDYDSLHLENYQNWNTIDAFLLKINTNLDALWLKHAGSVDTEYGRSIALDNEGNLYWGCEFDGEKIIFQGDTSWGNNVNALLCKINTAGEVIWKRVFTSKGGFILRIPEITINSDGKVWVAIIFKDSVTFGDMFLSGFGKNDFAILQIDSQGNVLQNFLVGSGGSEYCNSFQLIDDSHLFISGSADLDDVDSLQFLNMTLYDWENHTGPDFYFTLDLPVVSTEVLPDAPGEVVLAPNPVQAGHFFQVMCEAEFQEGHAMLYDHLGHVIRQTSLPPAGKQFFLPAPLRAGIYFLVVQTGNRRVVKKIAVTW